MDITLKILQKYWGFLSFREPQNQIIKAVLNKKDTFALLPTGGGKSICFQVPALANKGICIVISPLIALMQDQVESLANKKIKASTIPSGISQDDIITLFDNLKFGNYKFLYLSPERLQSKFIQQKIKELHVNLIAIDEAHCISEWGHDFRPSYKNIKILRELKPTVNFIALTASATQIVIKDIVKNLELRNPIIIKKSFFRKNLAYQIYTIEDKLQRLKQILQKNTSPAIIYINSRKKTVEIANYLNANKFNCSFYHGGLTLIEKQTSFNNWMSEKTPIMVATNAFGMGIDKPNVKIVIHLNLPNSIENYLQEAGRAGRNGEKSYSIILQNNNDIALFNKQINNSLPTIIEIKEVYKKLHQYFRIANGEFFETSFDFNFLDFCKKHNFIPHKIDSILKILNNNGVITLTYNFNKKSTVKFTTNSYNVINYKAGKIQKFLSILLRNYGGLFEHETKINEFLLAKKTGTTSKQIVNFLNKLHQEEIISYQKASNNSEITFLTPREDGKTINRISKDILLFIKQKKEKATSLVNFIKNNSICRSIQILYYFNEKKVTNCGICDVCISKKKTNTSQLSNNIILLLKNNKNLSSQEISTLLDAKEKDILIHLRKLLTKNKIAYNHQNKFYLT